MGSKRSPNRGKEISAQVPARLRTPRRALDQRRKSVAEGSPALPNYKLVTLLAARRPLRTPLPAAARHRHRSQLSARAISLRTIRHDEDVGGGPSPGNRRHRLRTHSERKRDKLWSPMSSRGDPTQATRSTDTSARSATRRSPTSNSTSCSSTAPIDRTSVSSRSAARPSRFGTTSGST